MPFYCVYILAGRTRRLYVGATRHLAPRLYDHRTSPHAHFTRRYNIDRLVYVERTENAYAAVGRGRLLEGWRRARVVALIERDHPAWADLRPLLFGTSPRAAQTDPSLAALPQDDGRRGRPRPG